MNVSVTVQGRTVASVRPRVHPLTLDETNRAEAAHRARARAPLHSHRERDPTSHLPHLTSHEMKILFNLHQGNMSKSQTEIPELCEGISRAA